MVDDTTGKLQFQSAVVIVGDLACFFAFALIGLRSHEDGITLSSVLRAAAPFQLSWLLTSFIVGLQGRQRELQSSGPRLVLNAWLPAWVLGLALRTFVLGRAFSPTFAIVALLFNGALLVIWRSLAVARFSRRG